MDYNQRLALLAKSMPTLDLTINDPAFMLGFEDLYLIVIIHLGKKLLEAKQEIQTRDTTTDEQLDNIQDLLAKYGTVLSVYTYLIHEPDNSQKSRS
jgi:hypothetical protein